MIQDQEQFSLNNPRQVSRTVLGLRKLHCFDQIMQTITATSRLTIRVESRMITRHLRDSRMLALAPAYID